MPLPEHRRCRTKGQPQSLGGVRAWLALSQHWCQGDTAMAALGMWERERGIVAQEIPAPPTQHRSAESIQNFLSVFPGVAAHSCPALPLPCLSQQSRKTPPEPGLGGLTPLQGTPNTPAPNSQILRGRECPACSPWAHHTLGSALQGWDSSGHC